jgi:hypothetical protein
MIKVPVRYLALIQDVLKFLTLAFGAVVTYDVANYCWYGTSTWLFSLDKLAAIFLILVTGWILYLSSINSLVKACVSENDLSIIPRENEKGVLLSVYETPTPCDRNMVITPEVLPAANTTKESDSNIPRQKVVTASCIGEGTMYPYIRDKTGAVYQISQECWKSWKYKLNPGDVYQLTYMVRNNIPIVSEIEYYGSGSD